MEVDVMAVAAEKLRVLFLCTGNSCRSQMAEGWARALRSSSIEPYSAGTDPHGMNRLAVRAMAEAGVDITGHESKRVDALSGVAFDFVVTVCDSANEACPYFPGPTKVIHFGFDDPPRLAKGAKTDDDAMPHYRRVRDEIRQFVETLPQALTGDSAVTDRPCCDDSCCPPDGDAVRVKVLQGYTKIAQGGCCGPSGSGGGCCPAHIAAACWRRARHPSNARHRSRRPESPAAARPRP
jgi:arsenate reductase